MPSRYEQAMQVRAAADRRLALLNRLRSGETMVSIAETENISHSRVRQLVEKAKTEVAHAIERGWVYDTPQAVERETVLLRNSTFEFGWS